jgi:hypothetical protein
VQAFVADITQDQLSQQLPGPCVDFCSMVFVLSAVTPDKMPQVGRGGDSNCQTADWIYCITAVWSLWFVMMWYVTCHHRLHNGPLNKLHQQYKLKTSCLAGWQIFYKCMIL